MNGNNFVYKHFRILFVYSGIKNLIEYK